VPAAIAAAAVAAALAAASAPRAVAIGHPVAAEDFLNAVSARLGVSGWARRSVSDNAWATIIALGPALMVGECVSGPTRLWTFAAFAIGVGCAFLAGVSIFFLGDELKRLGISRMLADRQVWAIAGTIVTCVGCVAYGLYNGVAGMQQALGALIALPVAALAVMFVGTARDSAHRWTRLQALAVAAAPGVLRGLGLMPASGAGLLFGGALLGGASLTIALEAAAQTMRDRVFVARALASAKRAAAAAAAASTKAAAVQRELEEELAAIDRRAAEPKRADSGATPKDGLCCICTDKPAVASCVPCGHQCGCVECLESLPYPKRCPLCRAPVDRVLRIFKAN
jgi:hypothetical protein